MDVGPRTPGISVCEFHGSAPCADQVVAHIPPMQKCEVECECGAVYTRVELNEMYQQPKLHQFTCGVCGRTLEAGVTHSLIGYRMVIQPDTPFVEPQRSH